MSRRPTYLRVLAWSGCPLRCPYCHQEGDPAVGRGATVLPSDVLGTCLAAAARVGVQKFKLLGGEPLLRPDLPRVVAELRGVAPEADLSLITSGAVDPERALVALEAGVDRVNVSIHGWTAAAFAWRGGGVRQRQHRAALLDLLARRGLHPKLNYVYTGTRDDLDLSALGLWALGRGVTLSVLDDLGDPDASPERIKATVRRLLGPWERVEPDADPDSLPATHLVYADGRRVEVKSAHLGEHAPWRMCPACPQRLRCREGTFALRLTTEGRVLPCMHRPDVALDLATPARRSLPEAVAALAGWLQEVVS